MELKKGETIMTDAALHLPASFLREAFSERSGVPLDVFELYYRGKRLEGEAALASWGVEKDATIEVKMRGRGGTGESPGSGKPPAAPGGGDSDGAGGRDDGGGVKGGVVGVEAFKAISYNSISMEVVYGLEAHDFSDLWHEKLKAHLPGTRECGPSRKSSRGST